jgi:hypothetical protein
VGLARMALLDESMRLETADTIVLLQCNIILQCTTNLVNPYALHSN